MWTSQYLAPTILLWPAIFQLGSAAAITHRDLQPFVWNSNGGFTMAADSGCTDKNPHNPKETKYDFLYRGFAGTSELSQVTWDRFNKNTYPELKKGPPDEKKQKEIDTKDPAYVFPGFFLPPPPSLAGLTNLLQIHPVLCNGLVIRRAGKNPQHSAKSPSLQLRPWQRWPAKRWI